MCLGAGHSSFGLSGFLKNRGVGDQVAYVPVAFVSQAVATCECHG